MAEFDVTLSALTSASTNIRKYSEEFQMAAEATYQVATTLAEAWTGDASGDFVQKVAELRKWMSEMEAAVADYAKRLDAARERYDSADRQAAGNF